MSAISRSKPIEINNPKSTERQGFVPMTQEDLKDEICKVSALEDLKEKVSEVSQKSLQINKSKT